MYATRIDFRDAADYLSIELEKFLPCGAIHDKDKFWGIVDECFTEDQHQDYTGCDFYEIYSQSIATDVLRRIMDKVVHEINTVLDRRVVSKYRYVLPDSVYCDGYGVYKSYWRVNE